MRSYTESSLSFAYYVIIILKMPHCYDVSVNAIKEVSQNVSVVHHHETSSRDKKETFNQNKKADRKTKLKDWQKMTSSVSGYSASKKPPPINMYVHAPIHRNRYKKQQHKQQRTSV